MNRGVVHSSPVQQMMAAGNPNWWAHNNNNNNNNKNNNLNNYFPPHASSPFLFASPITPESSWSHLSGLVGEEERSTALMNNHQPPMDQFVKQERNNYNNPSSPSHHGFVSHLNNEDFSKSNHNNNNNNNSSWSPHHHNNSKFIAASNSTTSVATTTTAAASSPQSCLSNNLFEFSSTTTAAKSDNRLKSDKCNSPAVKKAKVQTSASALKVRKFGDRITTLHQLVSPFGKTDTASVLLEAIGYVRFLQSQIEALSLPYLSSGQGNNKNQQPHSVQGERKCIFPEDSGQLLNDKCLKRKGSPAPEEPKDLTSRGLCLVPVSSTLNVGRDYGADYCAPTLGDFQ